MSKFAILYDSRTGTTKQAAEWIAEGMQSVDDTEVRCFSVKEAELEYVRGADGVILGAPTYFASITGTMKLWLEGHAAGLNLAGKLGGAFATEQYVHGGGEAVIQELLAFELCGGMAVYSGGAAHGKPAIHFGPVGLSGDIESFHDLFVEYGKRFASFRIR